MPNFSILCWYYFRVFVIVAERVAPIQSGSKNFLSAKTLLIIGQKNFGGKKI
jgi:hypothetical protein